MIAAKLHARPTLTAPWPLVGVLGGELVASLAVSLAGVPRRRRVTASVVLGTGDRFQMVGIHAAPIATEVVDLEPLGDWSDEEFVGGAVDETILTLEADRPVTGGHEKSLPLPTSRFSNDTPRHEAPYGIEGRSFGVSVSAPPFIVLPAPPPRLSGLPAALDRASTLRHVDILLRCQPWPGLVRQRPAFPMAQYYSELGGAGIIETTGTTEDPATGRMVQVYALTPHGWSEYRRLVGSDS